MASPENRKSVTIFELICADGTAEVPPAIVASGKCHMESWYDENNLEGGELILLSATGYINE